MLLWTWLTAASANPIDAWGPNIEPAVVALNPNLNVFHGGVVEGQAIGSVGLGQGFDVNLSLAVEGPPAGAGTQELLLRWFPVEQVGIVAHGVWTPADGAPTAGPAVHTTWPIERSAVYVDAGWQPGAAWVVAGGEVPVGPRVWLFAESHQRYDADGALLLLTPGLYLTFDDRGDRELCMGWRLPAVGGWEAGSVGVWFNQNLRL